jgi:hypothetical protein
MHQKRLWLSAAIIAVVILLTFAISVPRTREVANTAPTQVASSTPIVKVHDSYRRGTHTITGSIEAPNACTSVEASAILEGSASSTARVLLTISLPADTGICLQLPTPITFQTSVEGPAEVIFTATVNGELASTTKI